MGYHGLKRTIESDLAANLEYEAIQAFVNELDAGLIEDGNEWNTCGPVNVALILESLIKVDNFKENDDVIMLAEKTAKKLDQLIRKTEKDQDWDDKENKQYHLRAYKRMLRNMKKYYED